MNVQINHIITRYIDGNPHTETIGYRDYMRSCEDYENYEEALMEGIKYCLIKL